MWVDDGQDAQVLSAVPMTRAMRKAQDQRLFPRAPRDELRSLVAQTGKHPPAKALQTRHPSALNPRLWEIRLGPRSRRAGSCSDLVRPLPPPPCGVVLPGFRLAFTFARPPALRGSRLRPAAPHATSLKRPVSSPSCAAARFDRFRQTTPAELAKGPSLTRRIAPTHMCDAGLPCIPSAALPSAAKGDVDHCAVEGLDGAAARRLWSFDKLPACVDLIPSF